ncbi:hypothetical protein [Bacillus sp. MRMR6]|uniref:hypothetical protein n=1 Tax=Bacillus sp. MRMR6 TaxID=1928617 RepID=UPI0009513ADC|nr:hypothetical protein [Bacillus sp. MRMR6]OLS41155.1 hypothetical protein BTR25_04640 [Bacillus sp. MRMR6]
MERTLKLILNELKELKEGQKELKKDVSNIKEGQKELKKDVSNIKEGQKELKKDVSNIKEGQIELKKDVSNLKEGQKELKKDVSSIKDNLINGLGPYFEHIEKHIDEKTVELKGSLEDQQRVIDTLAARSVKHESEMKDFKRIVKNQ